MRSGQPKAEPGTVARALGRLRVALDATYTQASRELGLTPQQTELLCAAMRPTAIGDLAEVLRCDRSNVSRLVDRAASRGLVRRRGEQADGRVTVIELTADGQRLAERFIKTLESQLRPLLAGWSSKRQHAAVETLTTLADALEQPTAAPTHSTRRRATRPHTPNDSDER
jgi:DNA-binding MarR family transcriptional regulator